MRPGLRRLLVVGLCLAVSVACATSPHDVAADQATATSDAPVSSFPNARPSEGCTSSDPKPASAKSVGFESGGENRTYNLTVPAAPPDQPLPLVILLHGATGTDHDQEAVSGFPALAEQKGFVEVAPQAVEPGRFWRLGANGLDQQFIDALIDHTSAQLCVDLSRVYLAGFSLGGMFSMQLACTSPERFAAIAVVAGLIDMPCGRTEAVPLVAFQGTDDQTVRADGSYPDGIQLVLGGKSRPRDEIARSWADGNACSTGQDRVTDQGAVEVTSFACPAGADVVFYRIAGGTHQWPGGHLDPHTKPSAADTAVNATQVIWEFFGQFQR